MQIIHTPVYTIQTMKTIFAVLFLVGFATAYITGNKANCRDMLPEGVDAAPQETPSPYSLVVEELENEVAVTILAPENDDFIGFILQGRNIFQAPIGQFTVEDPEAAQLTDCPGGTANEVRQKTNDPKTRVAVSWTGPAEPITFTLTVQKDEQTFWLNQTAAIGGK